MRFESYQYLFPPRPETAVGIADLAGYERDGYGAQIKKHGTCNVIAVSPQRKLRCMTRHGPARPHRQWAPSPASARALQGLSGDGWYVFAGELLHAKGPRIKDTNYLFDILVADGEYLVGVPFAARQALLHSLFAPVEECTSHLVIDPHLWLARTHHAGFEKLHRDLRSQEDEGLVLKNPAAPLRLCYSATANRDWQVKCLR